MHKSQHHFDYRQMPIKECYSSGEHVIAADGLTNDTLYDASKITPVQWTDAIAKFDYKGILLKFDTGNKPASQHKFKLSNGLKLTFGQIMSISGDLFSAGFGDKNQEGISDGGPGTEADSARGRLLQAYQCLNLKQDDMTSPGIGPGTAWCRKFGSKQNPPNAGPLKQVPNFLNSFGDEISTIAKFVAAGSTGKNPYDDGSMFKGGEKRDLVYNSDSGGTKRTRLESLDNWPVIQLLTFLDEGRMTALATFNWDHFAYNGYSAKAYLAGHLLAIDTAAKGDLELAYAYDAYACHFLSDMFAVGHLRTPRKALYTGIKTSGPSPWSSSLGGYLSKMMHDEDNKGGLWIYNGACEVEKADRVTECKVWKGFGDNNFANLDNKENRNMQLITLQASVDEIYDAYKKKTAISTKMPQYFPRADSNKFPKPPTGNDEFDKIANNRQIVSHVGKTIEGQIGCINMKNTDEDCVKYLGPDWSFDQKHSNGCVQCSRPSFNRIPMFQQDQNSDSQYYKYLFRRKAPCTGSKDTCKKASNNGSKFLGTINGVRAIWDFWPPDKPNKPPSPPPAGPHKPAFEFEAFYNNPGSAETHKCKDGSKFTCSGGTLGCSDNSLKYCDPTPTPHIHGYATYNDAYGNCV